MRTSCVVWSGLLTVFLIGGLAQAQPAGPFDAPPARVARGSVAQPLLQVPGADAADVVRAYLRTAGHSDATIASLVVAGRSTSASTGLTHLRFTQRANGLDVYGTYVKATVNGDGSLTSLVENLVPARTVGTAALAGGEAQALAIGLQHVHGGAATAPGLVRQEGNTSVFARTAFFSREPTVTRVAVPVGSTALRVGYLVETWARQGNLLHHTLVGGDGAVLGVEVRTNNDSYQVFMVDPITTPTMAVVSGPAAGDPLSPLGWLGSGAQTTTSIAGNNVHAYLDTDANNAPDEGGTAVTNGEFLSTPDLDSQPSIDVNRAVATQNLFFLNNRLHDELLRHGFTEAAGNFQETNFTADGQDSDGVLAEVQDGSGTDNANFATPTDGSNPRMQMFLWTGLGNAKVDVGANTYDAQIGSFSAEPSIAGTVGDLALADDGVGTTSDACERFPRNALAGKVALVDRGTCDFTLKVSNAHRAGAVAVIVANNVDGAIFTMGGTRASRIPAVMVSKIDGAALRTTLGAQATVRATDPPPIDRDSSLDSDVVYHEYGHGLTWRMIGSMSGEMAGAIGEGMSDVLAMLFNGGDTIGEYSASDPAGIRSEPYANYSRTYGDFSGSGVHFDGEIYGAIGYDLIQRFGAAGAAGVDTLFGYVVRGMNDTPASPAFEDMRDGILQAVVNEQGGTEHECRVWQSFAKYGVGVGADALVRRGRVRGVTESFDVPAQCQP